MRVPSWVCRRKSVVVTVAAVVGLAAGILRRADCFAATHSVLATLQRPYSSLRSSVARRAAEDSGDGFIDQAFTVITDIVVAGMPLTQQEKDAYQLYRKGMAAQTSGDYSTALKMYADSLKLEEDPIDRSYIFYNLGLIFYGNGEFVKAVKYYHLALDSNKEMCQAYNNIAVIYHSQGEKAQDRGNFEKSKLLFDKAAQYWNQAVRIAPTNYLEAVNWLKNSGRATSFVDEKLGGVFG
mmetsp:Transcript_27088/g.62666  ORF Transcript_27088/g.62666 Transcript_27088/m.62666 type:complete len:238 (-) Transcript_27088:68-781(-)